MFADQSHDYKTTVMDQTKHILGVNSSADSINQSKVFTNPSVDDSLMSQAKTNKTSTSKVRTSKTRSKLNVFTDSEMSTPDILSEVSEEGERGFTTPLLTEPTANPKQLLVKFKKQKH